MSLRAKRGNPQHMPIKKKHKTMKKITLSLAVAVIALASCQKPETALPVAEQFSASVESFESPTKTSMTPEKYVVWSQNDRLAIFQGSTLADEYKVSDASVGKANGTFSIVADDSNINGDFSAGTELPCNVALYPYADDLTLTGSALEDEETIYEIEGLTLPAEQVYVEGSFANGAFPMVAVTANLADHNLKFKNLLGALKLQLKGTQKVMSIKVTGKNNEVLSGSAVVTAYTNNLTPAVTMTPTDDASKSVTLTCGNAVQLNESKATDFIIALPPVLFTQGFTVTVTDSEDATYTVETDKANTVLRSSILTMPAFTLGQTPGDEEDGTDSPIKVLGIAFDKSTLTLAPSTSYSLITVVVPDAAEDKTLIWSSNDPTIATVDQSGVVTAVSDGTASITAVAVGGASKSCTVNVISIPTSVATIDYVDEYGVNHGKGVAIGGTVWAPVNCGYKAATDTDKGYPYGKLYQWGRKYGQGYSAGYDQEPKIYNAPVSQIVGQDKSMQDYFFVGQMNWIEKKDDKLWNSGTEDAPVKTGNDPCPDGWRVPTCNELWCLRTDCSDWTIDQMGHYGCYFRGFSSESYDTSPIREDSPMIFLPAAGCRYYDGYAEGREYDCGYGRYWSSLVDFTGNSLDCIVIDKSYGYTGRYDYSQANAFSVRCVQE